MNQSIQIPDNTSRPIVGINPDDDSADRREAAEQAAYNELVTDGWLPDGRDVSAVHDAFMDMEQGELMELAMAVKSANDYDTLAVARRIGDMLNKAAEGEIKKALEQQ